MTDKEILAHFDKSALIGIRVLIAVFTVSAVILAFVFSLAITLFIVGWLVVRKVLVFVLARPEIGAVFAMVGGRL